MDIKQLQCTSTLYGHPPLHCHPLEKALGSTPNLYFKCPPPPPFPASDLVQQTATSLTDHVPLTQESVEWLGFVFGFWPFNPIYFLTMCEAKLRWHLPS